MSFISKNKVFKRNWNWLRPAASAPTPPPPPPPPELTLVPGTPSALVGVTVTDWEVTNTGTLPAVADITVPPQVTTNFVNGQTLPAGVTIPFNLTALAAGVYNVALSSPTPGTVIVNSPGVFTGIAAPPPPPAPPATLIASLDYTPILFPTSPPAAVPTDFVGGPRFTNNNYPGPGDLWYGPEPSCPAPYPLFLGCTLGANIFRGEIITRDGLSNIPPPVRTFLAFDIEYTFQIRPDSGPNIANELVRFNLELDGQYAFQLDLEYNNRTIPVRNLYRLTLLDFGAPIATGTFPANHFTLTPTRKIVRIQNKNFVGTPNENDISLYEFDTGAPIPQWNLLGTLPGAGSFAYLLASLLGGQRFGAIRFSPSQPSNGSLINVQRIGFDTWLP